MALKLWQTKSGAAFSKSERSRRLPALTGESRMAIHIGGRKFIAALAGAAVEPHVAMAQTEAPARRPGVIWLSVAAPWVATRSVVTRRAAQEPTNAEGNAERDGNCSVRTVLDGMTNCPFHRRKLVANGAGWPPAESTA